MHQSKVRALAIALALFLAVYAPTFVAVGLIHPPAQGAVPLIIGLSLVIALVLIWALARGWAGVREFGFSAPRLRYLGAAVLLGLPLALLADWLSRQFPSQSPLSTAGFAPSMLWLCFALGAPVQEEVIFRGLIQSFLQRAWDAAGVRPEGRLSVAVLSTAVLFGIVHLDSGLVVAGSALVLGLVAGELRRRSRSLLPAVIVHALFNLPDLVWR